MFSLGLDVWGLIGVGIAAIIAVFGFLRKTKKAGRDELLAEQARQNDEFRAEFDRIDSRRPDLDDSLSRLRERATRDTGTKAK